MRETNEALIAELLEALKGTLHCLEWHSAQHGEGMDAFVCQKARETIAKADAILLPDE